MGSLLQHKTLLFTGPYIKGSCVNDSTTGMAPGTPPPPHLGDRNQKKIGRAINALDRDSNAYDAKITLQVTNMAFCELRRDESEVGQSGGNRDENSIGQAGG